MAIRYKGVIYMDYIYWILGATVGIVVYLILDASETGIGNIEPKVRPPIPNWY